MDDKDELLREIERALSWATEPGNGTGVYTDSRLAVRVSANRAPEALRKIAVAVEKAKTLRGVRW